MAAEGGTTKGVVEDAERTVSPLLKQSSLIFEEANPYTAARATQEDAAFYPPVESMLSSQHIEADSDKEDFYYVEDAESAAPEEGAGLTSLQEFLGEDEALVGQSSSSWWSSRADVKSPSVPLQVTVRLDDYANPKDVKPDGSLKPRRGVPHIRVSDLLAGLTREKKHWVFHGELNQWPAYTGCYLKSITKQEKKVAPTPKKTLWKDGDKKPFPQAADFKGQCRATFLAPKWTSIGWAVGSPGFVYWYSEQHDGGRPRCLIGEGMRVTLKQDDVETRDANVTDVHCFAHRYPVAKETAEDRLTWHTGCMVEWSHRKFVTILELAFRHGVGGYGGKANWCEDKLEATTRLLASMPPGMIRPWDDKTTEIRMYDMPLRDLAGFKAFMAKYDNKSGLPLPEQRFLEPQIYASGKLALRECTAVDLTGYIMNYASRVTGYERLTANCQTFVADFYAFATGTKNVHPFSSILLPVYRQRQLAFVYPSDAYEHPEEPLTSL